ncbi:hypothetical protein Lser_V15G33911 [Lactuca serriola]
MMEASKGHKHVEYYGKESDNNEAANIRGTEVKAVLNFSIQTGEEFAVEFMRDRVMMALPFIPYPNPPAITPGMSHVDVVERETGRKERKSCLYDESGSNKNKIKILCSFGGKILPRPSDGKLRYVGGDTMIIRIRKDMCWQELWQKTTALYSETCSIKYQLPGEDLDALVSVSCDEDLQNMMEECNSLVHVHDHHHHQKLRMFLFSLSDLEDTHYGSADSEVQFVVAVNGLVGSTRRMGHHLGRNNLNELHGHNNNNNNADMGSSRVPPVANSSISSLPLPAIQKQEVENGPPNPKLVSEDSYLSNNKENDDLIDLSYLEPPPPPRVYHSERIPQGPTELNRLTKSDDTLASQFLLTQARSDFISEAVEDPIPISTTKNEQILKSGHETNTTEEVINHKPAAAAAESISHFKTNHTPPNEIESQGDIVIDVKDRLFLSDIFTRAMMSSEEVTGVGVLPQDGAGLSFNIANHKPQHWSFFQKLAAADVSLIHQDQLAEPPKTFLQDDDPSQLNVSQTQSMQFVENMMRMPEAEIGNVRLPSLADLDISSLQMIRNEDVEELKEVGSGTFGTVYHGKWRGTDVAIKRINKSRCRSIISTREIELWREAEILSKLHHPNVVAFYGIVQDDGPGGTLATVTEFMVDGSLRRVLLGKDRHLDHRKKLIIAMDAAFGMEYLHSKNIVHFDLKCDNLLVNMKDPSRPICKVGDFGLSKMKRNTLVSGGVRGTLPWMAPELLNGSSNKVSEKVDVFSFGIVLWEILTGEEPYANMHYGAIIGGIVSNTLRTRIPRDCDGEWRRLMEHCWAPNPMLRPSFTEITTHLRLISAASHPHPHKGS